MMQCFFHTRICATYHIHYKDYFHLILIMSLKNSYYDPHFADKNCL